MELIVVQTRLNNEFTQSFYRSNGSVFDKVYHLEALNRTTIVPAPVTIDGHDYLIIHGHPNAASFDILSVNTSPEMPKDVQMTIFKTVHTVDMKQLIAGNGAILVILGIDDVLTVIDYSFEQRKIEREIHNATEIAARSFEQTVFIAVKTISENGSAHVIEIYK